jgi:Holliday junction DNA helicase RuvA
VIGYLINVLNLPHFLQLIRKPFIQMITYLRGNITQKTPTYIVIEAAGVGYLVHISLHTFSQIEKKEEVKILTHLNIKEDSHSLYGFAEETERSLFRHLISVSGIGPNTAQIMLSSLNPEELRSAIIGEQEQVFRAVKGIGPKMAKRIILDLKDKLVKDSGDLPLTFPSQNNTIREEALSALVALGFQKIAVQKALNHLLKDQSIQSVEQLIKLALRELSA